MSKFNSVEGVDYLVDHYAILGVERTALPEDIEAAFRSKIKQWHPDRLHGLAPELVVQAEQKTLLLNKAREVLCNPESRLSYDEKLSTWTKPISKYGEVIVDLASGIFSTSTFLEALGGDDGTREKEGEKLALQFSSFNPTTYALIRELMEKSEDPSADLRASFQEQVASRDLYLTLLEGFLWEGLGVRGRECDSRLDYIGQIESELTTVKEQAMDMVKDQVLLLTAGEQALLPPPDGMSGDNIDSAKALAHYEAKVGEYFDRKVAKLRPIAEEREKLLEIRFEQANIFYHPENIAFTSKLIVEVKKKGKGVVARFAFVLEETRAKANEELDLSPLDKGLAGSFLSEGYSIVSFELVDEIDIKSQLNRVIDLHAMKVPELNPDLKKVTV